MLKWEERIVEWVNRHMTEVAICFTVIAALWIRLGGRNYVGNDYHFSLYDIPGNCNSLLYRALAAGFMRFPDYAVVLMKYIAYAGDFAVALLSLAFLRGKGWGDRRLRAFFALTACLLSPVSLLYSVSGMKIHSVCMSLLLVGILCFRKGRILFAALALVLAALLYPAYWPVGIGLLAWMALRSTCRLDGKSPMAGLGTEKGLPALHAAAAGALFAGCLILDLYLEQAGTGGYFWGKLFLVDPATGERYAGLAQWLLGMCGIYGYPAAMGSLLLAFSRKSLRIPALLLQLLTIMYVGWQQTSFLAL